MKKTKKQTAMAILLTVFTAIFLITGSAYAHCDTIDGPVVATARTALAAGDITPLLKWVSSDDEETIRAAFKHTLAVRKLGDEARQLADMYFFETLVRTHRAGEGVPYTGLKPGTDVDPAVALADKALESGSAEKLAHVLTSALDKGIHQRFNRAMETKKHADESVVAGREFVEAYVQFTHYAEGIHRLLKGAAPHHEHP